jgi:hypothetical protein
MPGLFPVSPPRGGRRTSSSSSSSRWSTGLFCSVVVAALLASWPGQAEALPQDLPAERLRPALDRNGIIDVEWAAVPQHLTLTFGAWSSYANSPLVLYVRDEDNRLERAQVLVGHRVGGSATFSVALFERLLLGLELPLIVYQERPEPDPTKPGAALVGDPLQPMGLGDVRFTPKLAIWRVIEDGAPLDIALLPTVTVPSAALVNGALVGAADPRYMGEPLITIVPELAVSRQFGALRLATNLGYRVRQPTGSRLELGGEVMYRAGAAFRFDEVLSVPLELATSLGGQSTLLDGVASVAGSPLEWLGQAKYEILPSVFLQAGAGAGVVGGYGTPQFRVFAGAQFAPNVAPPRSEHCALGPEDVDGFQDDDACFDPDNDGDGVLDPADACPMEREDVDGTADFDGCPDPDNDGDGILDVDDKCPNLAGSDVCAS